ncbi:MAG: efflux RND transporter periplasmic adaptor subunit [Zoogloeaceae bacterium]|nr:efflux RND transporter periplasmic adaptor subunit [Zoogloeaceae bacterium]
MFTNNKKSASGKKLLALTAIFLMLASCSAPEASPEGAQTSLWQGLLIRVGLKSPPPPSFPPLPVTVLEVAPRDIPYTLEVMAQTEGAKEAQVRARVGGILTRQLYVEGEPVKAGQPLFQIDRAPYEIALAEARARAEQTARERGRMAQLLPLQGVSKKEFDDAESADKLAQAALKQAELNLSWTTVAAPVSGISGRADKSVGNLITVGTDSLLTTVYQNDPIWARFSLAENEIARLPGGKLTTRTLTGVELILPDGSAYPGKGKLNFLASSIDTVLGTRQLRAEFPNAEDVLLPGQFARVRLFAGERKGVYLVPQTAVIQSVQGDMLMIADAENKVAPRPVQLGDWFGKDWIILSGLNSGDRVIVDNILKLRPGMPVAPHAPQAPNAPAQSAQPAAAR